MSKERLEEIKQYLMHFYNAVDVEEDIKIYIFNTLKIEWLIEQAERVQELEEWRNEVTENVVARNAEYAKCREQNKRYRELLEKINETFEKYVTLRINESDLIRDIDSFQTKIYKALEGEK